MQTLTVTPEHKPMASQVVEDSQRARGEKHHGPIRLFSSLKNHITHESRGDTTRHPDSIKHRGRSFSLLHIHSHSISSGTQRHNGRGSSSSSRSSSSSSSSSTSSMLIAGKSRNQNYTVQSQRGRRESASSWKNSSAAAIKKHIHRSQSSPQLSPQSTITGVINEDSGKNGGHRKMLRRSSTVSGKRKVKMEYNPYGVLHSTRFMDVGTIFGHHSKPESQLMLPYPTADPNDYLPDAFKEKCQKLEDLYEIMDTTSIGSGGAAQIKKATLKSDSTISVALKKFSLFRDEKPKQYYQRVVQEYIAMKNCSKHLHNVSCYELLKLPVYMQRSWGMTMDFMPGDLFSQILKPSWRSIPQKEKLCYFKQICLGLKFLHECDIANLDVKPDNILVAENGVARITDLGCCEFGHEVPGDFKTPVKFRNKLLGTPPYQPPEISDYKKIPIDKRIKYDPFKFDYWSLGVLLFVVMTGKAPFKDCKMTDLCFVEYLKTYNRFTKAVPTFRKGKRAECPPSTPFSTGFGDRRVARIAWRLCDPDYHTRMTLPELFADDYFQKIEMCIDESNYECNFVHHKAAKGRKFKVPYGSDEVLVNNRRSSRRLTSSSSLHKPSLSTGTKNKVRFEGRRSSSASSMFKYPSLLEIGLRSKRRSSSKGSNSSSSDSDQPKVIDKKGKDSVSSNGYHLSLNPVHEGTMDTPRNETDDEIDPLIPEPKPKIHHTIRNIKHKKAFSFESHNSSSDENPSQCNTPNGSTSTTASSSLVKTNNIDWDKYENAITGDDTSENSSSDDLNGKTAEPPVEPHQNEIEPADKYKFVFPDGKVFSYEFDEDDYKNEETEYMVVNYEDLVKSTQFKVVSHAHNLY